MSVCGVPLADHPGERNALTILSRSFAHVVRGPDCHSRLRLSFPLCRIIEVIFKVHPHPGGVTYSHVGVIQVRSSRRYRRKSIMERTEGRTSSGGGYGHVIHETPSRGICQGVATTPELDFAVKRPWEGDHPIATGVPH